VTWFGALERAPQLELISATPFDHAVVEMHYNASD
jgi:hypothetical protein